MELLIGTLISALATAFALGIIELITPASFYRVIKIVATYPLNLLAFWFLDFKGFSVFVAAAAASLLALIITLVVDRLSVPQQTVVNRRNL
jgi:membrane protein implicated in regulation of membrane protease activity